MKLRNLFLASVACAGLFAACSNGIDEVIDNGNNGTNNQGVAYASFAYTLPNGSASTRATVPGTEVGTDAENKVVDIAFVLFNADNSDYPGTPASKVKVEKLNRDAFTPEGTGASTTYKTISPIMVSAGKQHVYVIVNPSDAVKGFNGAEEAFKKLAEASYKTGDGFMMSNADQTYNIEPTAVNTISNPVKLIVPVERMAARIDYTATKEKNEYSVVSAPDDKVTVQNYRIVNTRTNAFLLKRVGSTAGNAVIGAEEAAESYVIDPFFAEKSAADFFIGANYGQAYDNKLAEKGDYKELPTEAKASLLAYCHENTMEANVQKTGAATGLVFKAKYEPKLEGINTTTGDFYRYNGVLYPSLRVMYQKLNPKWNGTDKNSIQTDVLGFKDATTDFDTFAKTFDFDSLQKKYVDFYKGGICYYTTYLRHINNGDNQSMGIMEYAIVRNNIYKLSINTINKLGDPTAPVDPDKPVEEKDSYLDVTVNVLNWTTRNNAVDL